MWPGARACATTQASGWSGGRSIDEARLLTLLESFKDGTLSAEEALAQLSDLPYEDLGFAKVDHHRQLRKGFPEVVFGQGKTSEQVATLASAHLQKSDQLLITKAAPEAFAAVREVIADAAYDETSKTIVVDRRRELEPVPGVVVAAAGTSDLPVAREATVTAELMGCQVVQVVDVGVAGIHRLFDSLPVLREAVAVVAVAGMDGALPSVIAGLVRAPVIAVPTSVGYGASFGGISALLSMLNSCAPGVAVVNIDNGFGAGYLAALMVRSARGDGGQDRDPAV